MAPNVVSLAPPPTSPIAKPVRRLIRKPVLAFAAAAKPVINARIIILGAAAFARPIRKRLIAPPNRLIQIGTSALQCYKLGLVRPGGRLIPALMALRPGFVSLNARQVIAGTGADVWTLALRGQKLEIIAKKPHTLGQP